MEASLAYDTSPPPVMVARRPVLDRRLHTVGYRLSFAAGAIPQSSWPSAQDLAELADGRPAFVAATPDLVRAPWPPEVTREQVVLELGVEALPGVEILDEVTDRRVVVSVNVPTLSATHAADDLASLRRPGVQLLAADVETADQFEVLRQTGFDLFLGAFYIRPGRGAVSGLPAASATAFSTLAKLQEHGADLEKLSDIVRQDPGLSYRLLAYANSASVGLRRQVGTVRDALLVLGTRTVRQWATALCLSGLEHRPHALMATALVRARACELLLKSYDPELADRAFTVGLLSLLDAIMEVPTAQALAELPLADDITIAILDRAGPLGKTLERVVAFEHADFESEVLQGPAATATAGAYRDAVRWADGLA